MQRKNSFLVVYFSILTVVVRSQTLPPAPVDKFIPDHLELTLPGRFGQQPAEKKVLPPFSLSLAAAGGGSSVGQTLAIWQECANFAAAHSCHIISLPTY